MELQLSTSPSPLLLEQRRIYFLGIFFLALRLGGVLGHFHSRQPLKRFALLQAPKEVKQFFPTLQLSRRIRTPPV